MQFALPNKNGVDHNLDAAETELGICFLPRICFGSNVLDGIDRPVIKVQVKVSFYLHFVTCQHHLV